ncbi:MULTISPECIES: DUF1990 family protein [unclassified Microbacterium]|uniref:DUF1990 family protein n=1 Tax=unclassified Microbacterium TaxID=2609290 RepID=UPI00386322D1
MMRRPHRSAGGHLPADPDAGPSTSPASEHWEPGETAPFRRAESTTLIGHGEELWRRASRDLLRWGVKTRSGFRVDDAHEVVAGEQLAITAGIGPVTVREPVIVVAVVQGPNRVGYTYRTLPGHPVAGEEAFIVHRSGDAVFLTLRSLTAPAPSGFWRQVHPLLRLAQLVARRRYRRALR